jgi:hypothetical protein
MEDAGIIYGHLVYFTANRYIVHMAIGYIFWSFGIFSPILVCCTKKNLATLKWCAVWLLKHFFQLTQTSKLRSGYSGTESGLPDFSWSKHTKWGKNITNDHKLYQTAMNDTKWPWNIPNGHKIYQHLPFKGPSKFTQIGIYGLKTNHLATLNRVQLYIRLARMYCRF